MDAKLQQLFNRVESKIHFGDDPEDVRSWLLTAMQISEDTADQMIRNASKKRSRAIRIKALIISVISLIATLVAITLLVLTIFGTDGVYLVRTSLRIIFGCLIFLGLGITGMWRYVPKLVTGKDLGAAN